MRDLEGNILIVQTCLANSHLRLGRNEQASNMLRDIYSGRVRLNGEDHRDTIIAALNYTSSLGVLRRVEEAKSLLRKTVPVARRVLGEDHELTLMMRKIYAGALCKGGRATFNDLREAVRTYEDTERIARRVLGGSHPLTVDIGRNLQIAQELLRRAREAGGVDALGDAVAAMPPPGSA